MRRSTLMIVLVVSFPPAIVGCSSNENSAVTGAGVDGGTQDARGEGTAGSSAGGAVGTGGIGVGGTGGVDTTGGRGGANGGAAGEVGGAGGFAGTTPESCDYLSDIPIARTSQVRGDGPYLDVSGWDPHNDREGYKPIEIDGVTYAKGVCWFGNHGRTSFVEWHLGGQYDRLRFVVRIDDEKSDHYEWALVSHADGEVILGAAQARPLLPNGNFRAPEQDEYNPEEALIRVGGGARARVTGDGTVLLTTEEFYAFGPGQVVNVDVSAVDVLRISMLPFHHEQATAPHRDGLTLTPFYVESSFFDIVDFGDLRVCN